MFGLVFLAMSTKELTIESIPLRTVAGSAVKTRLKLTCVLFKHFHPFLVTPLIQELQLVEEPMQVKQGLVHFMQLPAFRS